MTEQHARGTFEVKLVPQALVAEDQGAGNPRGRMSIDKQFHGDLEATSQGEMLSVMDRTLGSGGYVAMEKVTGALHGKTGTFVLQHIATMTRGAPAMDIRVVPDSGTGELTGLTGKLGIEITQGKHSYTFDYTLTPAP